jgi:hypothetical protein
VEIKSIFKHSNGISITIAGKNYEVVSSGSSSSSKYTAKFLQTYGSTTAYPDNTHFRIPKYFFAYVLVGVNLGGWLSTTNKTITIDRAYTGSVGDLTSIDTNIGMVGFEITAISGTSITVRPIVSFSGSVSINTGYRFSNGGMYAPYWTGVATTDAFISGGDGVSSDVVLGYEYVGALSVNLYPLDAYQEYLITEKGINGTATYYVTIKNIDDTPASVVPSGSDLVYAQNELPTGTI